NKLDLERPDPDRLLGLDPDHLRLFQVVFLETALNQRQGEGGSIDGNPDFGEEVGDGTDVVFVAVGENQRTDMRQVFLEVTEVRHDQIDPEQLGVGEHHPGVNDDDVVAITDGSHVHAELAQTTERNYL